MENKTFEFHGSAGGYFVVFLVVLIMSYIPIFGWPFAMNFMSEWLADSTTINGRKIVYKAGYGESLKFIFINVLLIIITFGIFAFWFVPRMYRYLASHTSFVDEAPVQAPVQPAPEVAAPPQAPATV